MAVSANAISTTSASWTISGLSYDWNITQYSQAYVRFNTQTSQPEYPPPTGTNRSVSGTIGGLTPGATYTVEGFMVRTGGTFSAGTTTITMPSPPANLTGLHWTNITANSISIAWNTSPYATSYDVYKDNIYQTFTSGTSYTFGSLLAGKKYHLGAIPKNSWGSGTGDNIDVTTTGARPPSFSWTYSSIGSGLNAIVDHRDWIELGKRINLFRDYKFNNTKGSYGFTDASSYVGQGIPYWMYNQLVNSLVNDGMGGTQMTAFMTNNIMPSTKSSGDAFYASYLNNIVTSLNSIL